MSDFEKRYLKEAVCRMIDEDKLYGVYDTIQYSENNCYLNRRWEISINEIKEWWELS